MKIWAKFTQANVQVSHPGWIKTLWSIIGTINLSHSSITYQRKLPIIFCLCIFSVLSSPPTASTVNKKLRMHIVRFLFYLFSFIITKTNDKNTCTGSVGGKNNLFSTDVSIVRALSILAYCRRSGSDEPEKAYLGHLSSSFLLSFFSCVSSTFSAVNTGISTLNERIIKQNCKRNRELSSFANPWKRKQSLWQQRVAPLAINLASQKHTYKISDSIEIVIREQFKTSVLQKMKEDIQPNWSLIMLIMMAKWLHGFMVDDAFENVNFNQTTF